MPRITKNITSNVLAFVISAIIPILLTPFVIHRLGNSHYGLWILINSVIGYYGLLDLGIGSSVIRYVSKYVATDDEKNLNSFVNTVLFMFILVGVAAVIVSGVLSFFLADLFNLSKGDVALFSRLILVLGFAVALSFPARTFSGILRATQRYDVANTIDISCSIAKTGMVVYFLSRGGGLMALAVISLLVRFVNGAFSLLFALRKTPILKIDLRLAQKSQLKTIFGYSIFIFIWGIGDRLRFHMDSIVIGAFLSVGAITYYSIGAKLMAYYVEAISAFSSITTPIFSSMDARDQYEKIRSLLTNGTRYLSLIAIFVGASLILYGKPFIRLWIGEEYESSYYVMLILIVPYIMAGTQFMLLSAARGIGKHKVLSLVTIGEGVLNLSLSILLVKRYGIYGVALGTAIPMLIVKLFIQPVYICREVGIPITKYVAGLFCPFLAGVIYIAAAKVATSMFHIDSYIRLFAVGLVSFLFFAALASMFCLTGDERRFCVKRIFAQIVRT